MKLTLAVVLSILAFPLLGQQIPPTEGAVSIRNDPGKSDEIQALPDEKKPVLLIWQTMQRCYECNFRYLMGCTSDDPKLCEDINVPMKTVLHFGWYESEAQAIEDANKENLDVLWLGVTVKANLKRTDSEKHIPRPDDITPIHHYEPK